MSIIDEPKITKCSEQDSVYIKFYLDFKQFECENINEGTQLMIFKRAFDTCLFNIDVSLNNKKSPNLSYKEFCYIHLIIFPLFTIFLTFLFYCIICFYRGK